MFRKDRTILIFGHSNSSGLDQVLTSNSNRALIIFYICYMYVPLNEEKISGIIVFNYTLCNQDCGFIFNFIENFKEKFIWQLAYVSFS